MPRFAEPSTNVDSQQIDVRIRATAPATGAAGGQDAVLVYGAEAALGDTHPVLVDVNGAVIVSPLGGAMAPANAAASSTVLFTAGAGVAQNLTNLAARTVMLYADFRNTRDIAIGDSGVGNPATYTNDIGFLLQPGDSIVMAVSNANLLYMNAAANDGGGEIVALHIYALSGP